MNEIQKQIKSVENNSMKKSNKIEKTRQSITQLNLDSVCVLREKTMKTKIRQ